MASINAIKNAIISPTFDAIAARFYGYDRVTEARSRYLKLLDAHVVGFHSGDLLFFSSPGRIEVIGNHTDHNNGKVIAAAVSIDTLAAVTPRTNGKIRVASEGYPNITIDVDNTSPDDAEFGTSKALIKGVLSYFKTHGLAVGGFDATLTSNVFRGAGVSSSSSFEILIGEILNYLYNGGKVDYVTKALAGQYAENVYFGKPSGLMDQAAISLGGINVIDFQNPMPSFDRLTWQFHDLDIFVVNTGGDHTDLTPDYAAIKSEMLSVAAYFKKKVLREVTLEEFTKAVPELKKKFSGRAILRALHYFEENLRVDAMEFALNSLDEPAFLQLVNASGDSSAKLLQNLHSPLDFNEAVPLGVELSRRVEGVAAARVHGGGFAGTVLVFVKRQYSPAYYAYIKAVFGAKNIFKLNIREEGATLVPLW